MRERVHVYAPGLLTCEVEAKSVLDVRHTQFSSCFLLPLLLYANREASLLADCEKVNTDFFIL